MLKKQTVAFQILSFISFCYILNGCSPKQLDENQPPKVDCQLDQTCLSLFTPSSEIRFSATHLLVETPIKVNFKAQKAISKVLLMPINMNMGTLPLLLQKQTGNQYESDVLFGMCAEPTMRWQIKIYYKDGTTESTFVNSYWSLDYI